MKANNMYSNTVAILGHFRALRPGCRQTAVNLIESLGIPQRRIYDCLAVMETIGALERRGKAFLMAQPPQQVVSKDGAIPELARAILRILGDRPMTPHQLILGLRQGNFQARRCYDVLSVLEACNVIRRNQSEALELIGQVEFQSPSVKAMGGRGLRDELGDDELVNLLVNLASA